MSIPRVSMTSRSLVDTTRVWSTLWQMPVVFLNCLDSLRDFLLAWELAIRTKFLYRADLVNYPRYTSLSAYLKDLTIISNCS